MGKKETVRKKVIECVSVENKIMYNTNLTQLKNTIEDFITEYGEEAYIVFDYEREYYDGINLTAQLMYSREETDEEYTKRLKEIEKGKEKKKIASKKKKEEERALYEKLKAKFEKET